jgi:hypothetical protein
MSACRFATQLTGGGGGQTNEYQYIFQSPTNPIKLTILLDKEHSTEAVIGTDGGTLSATGADGTVYTLDIPAKALVNGIKITMTPVASLSRLPGGSPHTYAVQFAPEGLYFYEDAILTITPPNPIPVESQVFFDYHGDGTGFGLAAPLQDLQEMKIRVFHFSGFGVEEVSMNMLPDLQAQLPGDSMVRIESLVNRYLDEERARQRARVEATSLTPEELSNLIDKYEQQQVAPALESAGDSCEAGKDAIAKVLQLERERQLLGISSGMSPKAAADLQALISKAAVNCVKEEYQRCVDQHIINGMIPLYIGLMRENQLLGGENPSDTEAIQLAKDLTSKCLTFELQFHSKGSFDTGDGGYDSVVDGKIMLHFDPFTISGSGPLDNLSFEFRMPKGGKGMKCTANSTPRGSTFEAKSLDYIEDTRSETDPEPYVRDFRLTYFPGVTSESYNIHCILTDSDGHVTEQDYSAPPSGYWTGIFLVLHQEELNAEAAAQAGSGIPSIPDMAGLQIGALPAMPVFDVPEGGGFVASDWEVTPGDALMASKEWIKNDSAASITESGTLKLFHRPGE